MILGPSLKGPPLGEFYRDPYFLLQCLKLSHRRQSACLAGLMWASCGSRGKLDVGLTVAGIQLWSSCGLIPASSFRVATWQDGFVTNPVGDRSGYNASQGLRPKRKKHREFGPEPHSQCDAVNSGLTGNGRLAFVFATCQI